MYNLYTYPNCEKCAEVKKYLGAQNVAYSEVNIGTRDGKKEFGKVYLKIDSILQKDEHGIVMPILVRVKNGEGVEVGELVELAQDIKGIEKIIAKHGNN